MSSPPPRQLSQELLDDFYAESAELIHAATQGLTTAGAEATDAAARAHALEEAYGSIHTLKGITGIAGAQTAETLAHQMEDVLRSMTKGTLPVTPARIELLLTAIRRLEQIIAAQRAGQPAPEATTLAQRLAAELGSDNPTLTAPSPSAPAGANIDAIMRRIRDRGLKAWRCRFTPSVERDARGVNVTSVRERLRQLGEIFLAEPTFQSGTMAFEFVLGLPATSTGVPAEWAADGLTAEPLPGKPLEDEPTASPAPEAPTAHLPSLSPSHIVRVDLGRLDELMRIAGDVLIQRSRLAERIRERFGDDEALREIDQKLGRSFRELRRAVTRVRLVPIAEVFSRLPFVVRDLADNIGKSVRVRVQDHQTEIDKYLAERIKEPLLHLVRNACTHGIEPPAEREAKGKPAEATLHLQATSEGDFVLITVSDDGLGIDAEAVARRAAAAGLPVPEVMDTTALLGILCSSGFSTREEADRAAGRGIGMAIVANTVRELGGTLSLTTAPGRGTTFSLRLPLTLSITDVVVVAVGDDICGVPQASIDEIVQVPATAVRRIQQTDTVPYRDGLLPLIHLRTIFQLERPRAGQLTLVVLRSDHGTVGLVVDAVRSRREAVVRPLTDPLVRVEGFSGATELGNGRPILIMDAAALASGIVRPAGRHHSSAPLS